MIYCGLTWLILSISLLIIIFYCPCKSYSGIPQKPTGVLDTPKVVAYHEVKSGKNRKSNLCGPNNLIVIHNTDRLHNMSIRYHISNCHYYRMTSASGLAV
jgi:hypothetical protein